MGQRMRDSRFCLSIAVMKPLLVAMLVSLALTSVVSAVEFSAVNFAGKRFTVCRVEVLKEHLQLFHYDERGQPFKRLDRLSSWIASRGQKLVFAMNAGMYRSDYSTVGLFVSDGHQTAPLNTNTGTGNFYLKPNGVFVVTKDGARVIDSAAYHNLSGRVVLATQSGPLLVLGGNLHPAFNSNSESRLLRNGVGIPSSEVALFVISEAPVTFYELATLFRDKLHCPDALFLDGTISSLYAP